MGLMSEPKNRIVALPEPPKYTVTFAIVCRLENLDHEQLEDVNADVKTALETLQNNGMAEIRDMKCEEQVPGSRARR